jgi:6-phosphogluconolactonase
MYRFLDSDALASRCAQDFVDLARSCIAQSGSFSVALSGGSTPKKLHTILVSEYRAALDWSKVLFYLGDDRFVPPTDERSNERMVRQTLLYPLGISESRIFMPYADMDVQEAALQYDSRLPASLDLVLLGLGTDGHTLSLFPGEPFFTGRKAVAAKAPVVVADRITLTAEYANQCAQAWFLVAGADKQTSMQQMLQGDYDPAVTPSQAIARKHLHCRVFADEAALAF